ncbi:hypothetical protein MOX01_01700 [Microbacterium oxydans]|nr:hypothetical protein MOX01_01700 [Microbacterium oxydans]
MGAAAIVLSSWLILYMRAVYREGGGFRSGFANAMPLWVPGVTGVLAIFVITDWLVVWASACLPPDGWRGLGVFFVGLGLATALTAIGRLIYNRVRVGATGEPVDNGDENSPQPSSPAEASIAKRPQNLPVERRRVIVEFAVTYGLAALVIVIGAGLAWN